MPTFALKACSNGVSTFIPRNHLQVRDVLAWLLVAGNAIVPPIPHWFNLLLFHRNDMVLHTNLSTSPDPAPIPAISNPKLNNILVYEWQAWDSFLIGHLIDSTCRISARYDDPVHILTDALHGGIDAVLLQINVSYSHAFPQRRAAIIDACRQQGVWVLNAGIGDISKRHLHQLLARAGLNSAAAQPQGDPDEWLFVKSNLNWGGQLESRFDITRTPEFGITTDPAPITRFDRYYKVQRKLLDPKLWSDPRVAIERYISNPTNSFYRVYRFGAAVVVVQAHSPNSIKTLWVNRF